MDRIGQIAELMSTIGSIKRLMQNQTYACSDGTNLTSGQLSILFTLKNHGAMNAHSLAKRLSLTPGAISQVVELLTDREYIERTARQDDRRTYDLSLSEHGLIEINAIEQERQAIMTQLTADLTTDELQTLVQLLQKMMSAIRQ